MNPSSPVEYRIKSAVARSDGADWIADEYAKVANAIEHENRQMAIQRALTTAVAIAVATIVLWRWW